MKKELSALLDDLTDAVTPVLNPEFLCNLQVSPVEQEEFEAIKLKYTYPIIVTYCAARYFAGHILGPEALLPTYEIAEMLASPENAALAKKLAMVGDMANLMLIFGYVSRLMLELAADRDMDARIEEMSERKGGRHSAGEDSLGLDATFEKADVSMADLLSFRRPKGVNGDGGRERGKFWRGQDVDMWDPTKVV